MSGPGQATVVGAEPMLGPASRQMPPTLPLTSLTPTRDEVDDAVAAVAEHALGQGACARAVDVEFAWATATEQMQPEAAVIARCAVTHVLDLLARQIEQECWPPDLGDICELIEKTAQHYRPVT